MGATSDRGDGGTRIIWKGVFRGGCRVVSYRIGECRGQCVWNGRANLTRPYPLKEKSGERVGPTRASPRLCLLLECSLSLILLFLSCLPSQLSHFSLNFKYLLTIMLKDLVRGRGVKIMVLWAPGQGLFKEAWVDVCGIFYLCLLLSDPFPLSFLRWFGIRLRSWLRDKSWNLTVRPSRNLGPFIWSVAVLGVLGVSIGHQSISLGPRMKALDYLLACNLWFPPKNDLYALGL